MVLITSGCGTDSEQTPIAETQVAGTLGGTAWQVVASEVWVSDAFHEISLYADVPTQTCSSRLGGTEPHIFLRFPTTPGSYDLEDGLGGHTPATLAVWIYDGGSPAGIGSIEVPADLTPMRSYGGVVADFGSAGQINGQFEGITYCGVIPQG